MYDNETRRFVFCDWLLNADWFDDRDGFMYMVPSPEVVAEIDGPDGPLLDAMNAACRDHKELTTEDCERLGLLGVDDVLKRLLPRLMIHHAKTTTGELRGTAEEGHRLGPGCGSQFNEGGSRRGTGLARIP